MSEPSLQFFEHQRHAKRMSWLFFGLFVAVVLSHALVLFVFTALMALALTGEVLLSWWLSSLVFLVLYLVFSMALQSRRIKNGGQSMAARLGAVRLFLDKSQSGTEAAFFPTFIRVNHLHELPSSYQRYYEFAEQMSLASGITLPKLYVLPNEANINALVMGFDVHDMALVMTQGALEKLDNDSLYALIAHEFGHILHGDARLNLRLYVMMAGLSLFYEAAEWLERLLLGEFHAGYHGQLAAQCFFGVGSEQVQGVRFASRDEWIRHWQAFRHEPPTQFKSYNAQDADAVLLLMKLPVIVVLVVARLIGTLGMASSEWIKQKFNQQREYLADATSMQLTRSYGMVSLLNAIDGQDTSVLGGQLSAMDYFFFADPKAQDESHWFSSHPAPQVRLRAINAHDYDGFGLRMTAHLDDALLDRCHSQASAHAPVCSLAEELMASSSTAPEMGLAYETVETHVSEGRLIVPQAWYDGWQVATDWAHNQPSVLYPQRDKADTSADTKTATKPKQRRSVMAHFAAIETENAANAAPSFRLTDLPWTLSEQLRAPTGVLMLIESLLLCRFSGLSVAARYDFYDIYVKLPDEQHAEYPPLLPHTIKLKVLKAVAGLPRCDDERMLIALLNVLFAQIKAGGYGDKMMAVLSRYQCALGELIQSAASLAGQPPVMNAAHILRQLPRLTQGLSLAVVHACLVQKQTAAELVLLHKNAQNTLKALKVHAIANVSDDKALLLVLLAFLAGVQDNSLLLSRHETLLGSLRRWWRVLGVATDQLTDMALLALVVATHTLTVQAWAGLFTLWYDLDAHSKQRYLDSLHTALLFDGVVADRETRLWQLLQWFLAVKGASHESLDARLNG